MPKNNRGGLGPGNAASAIEDPINQVDLSEYKDYKPAGIKKDSRESSAIRHEINASQDVTGAPSE